MLIIGAKGHAKEIIEIFRENNSFQNLYFFDNISNDIPKNFYGFPILRNFNQVEELFKIDNTFCMGIGGTVLKYDLTQIFLNIGGLQKSVNSNKALIGENSRIAEGCNIMPFASVYNDVDINSGVLINSYASIHHDSIIGEFSEISPGAKILGRCKIGSFCSIGTNAVILPKIEICDKVIIGAGSVVNKNIMEEGTYVGVPIKKIK